MDLERLDAIRIAAGRQFAFEDGAAPEGYTAAQFYEDHGLVLDGTEALKDLLDTASSTQRPTDGGARAALFAYLDSGIGARRTAQRKQER